MIEHKLIKVDPDSPERCQGIIKNGQCPWKRIPNSEFCIVHAGGTKEKCNLDASVRNYRLAIWQSRVNEFADSSTIKSLREEIGISRMVLENIIVKCQDDNDLLLYSSKIADHVSKLQTTVALCHKLEERTGFLLDKSAILQIAGQIIEIISRYIDSPDILELISGEIIDSIIMQVKIPEEL
jgi:hypothetical protein